MWVARCGLGLVVAGVALASIACGSRTAPLIAEHDGGADATRADAGRSDAGGRDARVDSAPPPVDAGDECAPGDRRECRPSPPTDEAELCETGVERCFRGHWTGCQDAVFCGPVRDRFPYSDAVHVTLVVDQSVSMINELELVREHLDRLAGAVTESERPFGLTVIAGRGECGRCLCIPPPLAGPMCEDKEAFHQIDHRVNSWNSLDMIQRYIHDVDVYARRGSRRAFVVVSDDDEDEMTALDFDEWMRDQPGFGGYSFHAVVGRSSSTCDIFNVSRVYPKLAELTGGSVYDICRSEWAGLFEDIAADILRRSRIFALSREPLGELEVVIEGVPERPLPDDAWHYDADRNVVVLDDSSALSPGEALLVRYRAEL